MEKKFQFACVVFCMNNIMFLRKDGDMSMHAVILYYTVFGVKNDKKLYAVFLSWKSGKIFQTACSFPWWITCSLCVRNGNSACCFSG